MRSTREAPPLPLRCGDRHRQHPQQQVGIADRVVDRPVAVRHIAEPRRRIALLVQGGRVPAEPPGDQARQVERGGREQRLARRHLVRLGPPVQRHPQIAAQIPVHPFAVEGERVRLYVIPFQFHIELQNVVHPELFAELYMGSDLQD